MANGVMVELQRRGIRIPAQIAITGFDDINVSECLIPPLSTVRYPFKTFTTRATELLIQLIEGKSVPEVVALRAYFIPRHSCGCPDAPDPTDTPGLSKELEQLKKNASFKFPEYINRQILSLGRPILSAWREALTRLRRKGTLDLHSNTENPSLNHDQAAWELLGRTAYTTFKNVNHQAVTHNIEIALTSTQELAELINILTRLLPEAEIRRCCFCLYENQGDYLNKTAMGPGQNAERFPSTLPSRSRLVLSFNQAGPIELPPGGICFSTSKLLPEEIISKQGWKSWVIMPLYFKQEQFGYILMDSDAPHEYLSATSSAVLCWESACWTKPVKSMNRKRNFSSI